MATLVHSKASSPASLAARAVGSRTVLRGVVSAWRKFVWYVRQVTGDAAYENYLRCKARRAANGYAPLPDEPSKPVSEQEFYLETIRRQYSRISRCC